MKYKPKTVYLFVVFLIALLTVIGVYADDSEYEYIRFHVIANSDSPEDQAIKLRVRDSLLERFSREFANVDSIEAGRQKIKDSIDEIERIALLEIKRSGKSYPVNVQFGRFSFPTKAYGQLVLPAGKYEALKVIIGEGAGANWWCVMFPPLCFIDISHGVAKQREGAVTKDDGTFDAEIRDEEATEDDSTSRVEIVVIEKDRPREDEAVAKTGAMAFEKSVDKKDDGHKNESKPKYGETADDIEASSGVMRNVDEQRDVNNYRQVSVSYATNDQFQKIGNIEYRWKIVEWLKLSSVKIKRLFSFLSFWDG